MPHKNKYSSKVINLTSGYSIILSIDALSNLAHIMLEIFKI